MKSLHHPTAIISPKAKIANNVQIGAFTIIHDNVVIEEGTNIGSYCELGIKTPLASGSPLHISKNSIIRSHSVFYESSKFGEELITGHHVSVRENTLAGRNLQLGTLCDLQGDCEIGEYVRFHSNVHIGKKSTIGNYVWIFPYVVLTNDPHPPSHVLKGATINDFAAIATMSVILPGVTIGKGCLIGAHSCVKRDAEEGMLYAGNPAIKICAASNIKLQDGSQRPAYPWTNHFHRGYPDDVVKSWLSQENQTRT